MRRDVLTERQKLEQKLRELREDAAELRRFGNWYADSKARFAEFQVQQIERALREEPKR